jgi:hypothetical protein
VCRHWAAPRNFRDLFKDYEPGPRDSVMLPRDDGVILMRCHSI